VNRMNQKQYKQKTLQGWVKKIELNAASFSKAHCLMCEKKRSLHMIKPESILFAYQNYGLLIRKGSRCCDVHLENNGEIKYEEYLNIKKQTNYLKKLHWHY
jgi:hypothetical protein